MPEQQEGETQHKMAKKEDRTRTDRISRVEYWLQWGLILAMVGFGFAFFYVVISNGF